MWEFLCTGNSQSPYHTALRALAEELGKKKCLAYLVCYLLHVTDWIMSPHQFIHWSPNGSVTVRMWLLLIYLFIHPSIHPSIHERHRERQREKQAPCREPDEGLDPRTPDHTLSQRQMLNHWATQVPLYLNILKDFGVTVLQHWSFIWWSSYIDKEVRKVLEIAQKLAGMLPVFSRYNPTYLSIQDKNLSTEVRLW